MKWTRSELERFPTAVDWPPQVPDSCLIPMQAYAWMHARAAAVLRSPNLHLYALKDGPKVAALAPLLPEGNWLLELPRLHEPSDLVWSTPESLGELTAMLAAQPFPVDLERIPANSPTVAALRRAYARSGIVQVRPAMPTPVIALDMRWQEAAACFSAGRRSDFRRAERRARALGEVCYEIHSPASDTELDTLMNEAYAVEAGRYFPDGRRLAGKILSALYPKRTAQWRTAHRLHARGWLSGSHADRH